MGLGGAGIKYQSSLRGRVNEKVLDLGSSLVVQWLGLCPSTAGGTGSIPGQGTKIPHALRCSPPPQKIPNIKKVLDLATQVRGELVTASP